MLSLLADTRWGGDHGIGRFSRQLLERLPHTALRVAGRPMEAVDPFRLALALRGVPARSLFFSPGYNAPVRSPIPYVFTVHDLNHIDRVENSSVAKRLYYRAILRPGCRRAARVFTVSEYSRRRIVEWAGIAPDRAVNVGNGVGAAFEAIGPALARDRPYFLCVSNRRPHKNEARVVAALAAARLTDDVELLFTGDPSHERSEQIRAAGLTSRVHFTGAVTDAALAALYRGAIGLVFPSLYEGFGLPVVEAMACGAPVITSTTTALPEIAGDAALLVDPLSVEAIAAAMQRLADDSALRARLREGGLRRASLFQWNAVAERARAAMEGIE